MMTLRGCPISFVSRRRRSTFPREPVPPVMSTDLPSSTMPKPVVGDRIIRHCLHHGPPIGPSESCRFTIAVRAQAAIAVHSIERLDRDSSVERVIQQL